MPLARLVRILGLVVASAILVGIWGLASPVGSSADEDFHLTSIWCSWGVGPTCIEASTSDGPAFVVPDAVEGPSCFLLGDVDGIYPSAACLNDGYGPPQETSRSNWVAGYYPPIYYATARTVVDQAPVASVLRIRGLNALIAVAIIGFALSVATPWIRRAAALALLTTSVPMSIFFIASVNPSSWTIAGVGAFWILWATWISMKSVRSIRGLGVLLGLALATLLAASARSDGVVFIGASVIMISVVLWRNVKKNPRRLLLLTAALPFALWALSFRIRALGGLTGQTFSTLTEATSQTERSGALLGNLLRYAAEVPSLVSGIVGANAPAFNQAAVFFYGIGSIDVRMPSIVLLLAWGALAGVVFWGLKAMTWPRLSAVLIGLVIISAIPLLSVARNSFAWAYSPRYVAPFLVVIVGIVVLIRPWRALQLSRAQLVALWFAFTAANGIALLTTVRRYTNGQSETWLSFTFTPEWWWNSIHPLWLVAVGTMAGGVLAWGLVRLAHNPNCFRAQPSGELVR